MTELLNVIPTFPSKRFSHIIPSLEKNLITTSDLLTLEPADVARRAKVPVGEVRQLVSHAVALLQGELGLEPDAPPSPRTAAVATPKRKQLPSLRSNGRESVRAARLVSTLDTTLDTALGGGFPVGQLVEVVGESGSGKTQLLLSLLLSAQLPSPRGLGRSTLYLTTEHALPTSRLHQLLRTNPVLKSHAHPPSLSRILTLSTTDMESQEYVLEYQLPVAIQRHNVGLVVVDSIAANFRADSAPSNVRPGTSSWSQAARRAASLLRAGATLRSVARRFDCAVVVANQVTDRFPKENVTGLPIRGLKRWGEDPGMAERAAKRPRVGSPGTKTMLNGAELSSSAATQASQRPVRPDRALTVDHQLNFFSGWGDDAREQPIAGRNGELKTPALGLTWANQIAGRVALSREVAWAGPSRWQPPTGLATGKVAARDLVSRKEDGRRGVEVNTLGDAATPEEKGTAEWTPRRWRRWAKVVFASWTAPVGEGGRGLEFEIWEGGLRSIGGDTG